MEEAGNQAPGQQNYPKENAVELESAQSGAEIIVGANNTDQLEALQNGTGANIKSQDNEAVAQDTFYVQAFYHGGMNSFVVTPKGANFDIAYDGEVIAEIAHNGTTWQQTLGEPLDEDVFVSVRQAIEHKQG